MQASGLKVLVGGTLVVPPFECAWLTGTDLTFADGTGCICFEAKADTDVTVILKATPGARRWQPLLRADGGLHGAHAPGAAAAAQAAVEPNYTVIFGSHRNSCLKFEKNGSTLTMVRGVPGACVSGKGFLKFWVHYSAGTIAVGTGDPSLESLSYRWRDEDPAGPIPGIRHVGLSCWDRHACYRAIRLHSKPLTLPADLWGAPASALAAGADVHTALSGMGSSAAATGAGRGADGAIAPLLQLCCRSAQASLLGPSAVCHTLWVAELLRPNTRHLYRACLSALAQNLQAVHRADPSGLTRLPPSCLVDLLHQNDIPLGEKVIFDIVVDWAHGYFDNAVRLWCRGYGDEGLKAGQPAGAPLPGAATAEGSAGARGAEGVEQLPAWHKQQLEADVSMVLSMIRYPLMTSPELVSVRQYSLVSTQPEVLALVDEAMGLPIQIQTSGSAGLSGSVGQSVGTGMGTAGSGSLEGSLAAEAAGEQVQTGTVTPAPGSLYCVENKRLLRSSMEGHIQLHAHPCRYQRRCVPAAFELSYVCDGDQNGVLRYIGTTYGTQEWVNPVLAKRIDIKASSPSSRLTDPKALAGDSFVRHNFAGPRYINGQAVTWWCVDLGSNHQLLINYYTVRHDGCTDYPRHWVLQGSQDCSEWVDLRRHASDNSLRKPGQYASWPVLGPAASTPYRAFRLMLTGPTTSTTAPWAYCLSNLELYGYLTRLDGAGVPAGPGVGASGARTGLLGQGTGPAVGPLAAGALSGGASARETATCVVPAGA